MTDPRAVQLASAAARQFLITSDGRLTRDGIIFLNQLLALASQASSTAYNVADLSVLVAGSGVNVPNAAALAEESLLQAPAPNGRDFGPDIQQALLQAPSDPSSAIAGLQAQIDELRALLAVADPPAPLANGATGTITLAKLTTSNGSVTVVNGIITGFVNPT